MAPRPSRALPDRQKPPRTTQLLDFDSCARFRELLPDGLGFVLRNPFFDALRSAVHQVFCLFQTEAGDLAYCLDYIDLIGSHFLQNDGEFGLFFRRGRRPRRGAAGNHHPGLHSRAVQITGDDARRSTRGSASLNFFCSTPWLTTTARFRPTAFIAVTRRCDGAFNKNSSFE